MIIFFSLIHQRAGLAMRILQDSLYQTSLFLIASPIPVMYNMIILQDNISVTVN